MLDSWILYKWIHAVQCSIDHSYGDVCFEEVCYTYRFGKYSNGRGVVTILQRRMEIDLS